MDVEGPAVDLHRRVRDRTRPGQGQGAGDRRGAGVAGVPRQGLGPGRDGQVGLGAAADIAAVGVGRIAQD